MECKPQLMDVTSVRSSFVALFKVPFKTAKEASIACNSLRIDKEPLRGGVVKELDVNENFLKIKMSSDDVKKLRSAVTSFFDLLILVVNAIEQFG